MSGRKVDNVLWAHRFIPATNGTMATKHKTLHCKLLPFCVGLVPREFFFPLPLVGSIGQEKCQICFTCHDSLQLHLRPRPTPTTRAC